MNFSKTFPKVSAFSAFLISSSAVSYAFTPSSSQDGQSPFSMLFLMGALFLIMFFFVIRPQQKKLKAHKEMVTNLEKDDEVILTSGIYGKVLRIPSEEGKRHIQVEIAEKMAVKVLKESVSEVIAKKGKPVTKNEDKKKTKKAAKPTAKEDAKKEATNDEPAVADEAPEKARENAPKPRKTARKPRKTTVKKEGGETAPKTGKSKSATTEPVEKPASDDSAPAEEKRDKE